MDFTVEQMMKDGFTIKMANFYHELMKKERNSGLWSDEFIDTGLIITAFWLRVQLHTTLRKKTKMTIFRIMTT